MYFYIFLIHVIMNQNNILDKTPQFYSLLIVLFLAAGILKG